MIDIETHSEQDTIALGAALGRVLSDGDVLALQGDLGAGKTHTFTILNYYEHAVPLQHFDFYRLEDEYELDDLGFDDYLTRGVTVIEWSEKFPERLPEDAARVFIEKKGLTERIFHFEFNGARWAAAEKEVESYVVSH